MTKITSNNAKNDKYFDWRFAAGGAAGIYTTGLMLFLGGPLFICGGLAVASVWSFVTSVKTKPDTKQLHRFVPKPTSDKKIG